MGERIIIKRTEFAPTMYVMATRKMMFRLIFALAMAMKVSPKKLASFFNVKDTDKYARDINNALKERILGND